MKGKMFKIFLGFLAYILIFSSIPYIRQKNISEDYRGNFNIKKFYESDGSIAYADIIRDNNESLDEKIRAIDKAKKKIRLGNYRFLMDDSGKLIMSSLIKAAQRGVDIEIILDGNTLLMNAGKNDYYLDLDSYPNVDVKIYNPINIIKAWSINGRMHDKYMIVDDEIAFVGGRNLADRFLTNTGNYTYDWDGLIYYKKRADSDAINSLNSYFDDINTKAHRNKDIKDALIFSSNRRKDKIISELEDIYDKDKATNPNRYKSRIYEDDLIKVGKVSLISNPVNVYSKEPLAFFEISELMKNAKSDVTIHTPYFIGNKIMYDKLGQISKTTPTTLFTNSPKSGANTAGRGEYLLFQRKLRSMGLALLENERPMSYHGKAFAIDDNIAAIGSFNWDMRSTYIDTELMLVIEGKEINEKLREDFAYYEKDASRVLEDGQRFRPSGKDPSKLNMISKLIALLFTILTYPLRFLY